MTMLLETKVNFTGVDEQVAIAYDYTLQDVIRTEVYGVDKRVLPKDFSCGLIVGQSGSGKSKNLETFGTPSEVDWDNTKSLVSNFNSYEEAKNKLHGCGLNSIKVWTQPYNTLSTGQAYRADMARTIREGAVFDEFCSYLDKNTAKSLSNSVGRYIESHGIKGVVFATCNSDIEDWLQPDWTFDCNTGELRIRGCDRQRPKIALELHPCSVQVWEIFKNHHYLSADINKTSRCWVATWDGKPVGFYATLPQPSGTMKDAWRGTRMVVLPEFQGLGISTAMCEAVADIHLESGKRFFAKTASELLGFHRENSEKWKPTSKNKKKRKDYKSNRENKYSRTHKDKHAHRLCYSHEYLG